MTAPRLFTNAQVADRLRIQPRSVRDLARRWSIGQEITSRFRMFTEDDVAQLAQHVGKRGRPKKETQTP